MRRAAALLAAGLLPWALPATAQAAGFPLRPGSSGPGVSALQWVLGGHAPGAYKWRYFRGRPNGYWGPRTTTAVLAAKWRLGYPVKAAKRPEVDRTFMRIVTGRQARPIGWIFRGSKRQHAIDLRVVSAAWVAKLLGTERSQLGREPYEPWAPNWGPLVRMYQSATGAYRAAWCASFQQWVLMVTRYGRIADRSAGAFYIADWSRRRGWLRTVPAPGRIVIYMGGSGHAGMVERVWPGGYDAIEGNYSDAVRRVRRSTGERAVFVSLPNVS